MFLRSGLRLHAGRTILVSLDIQETRLAVRTNRQHCVLHDRKQPNNAMMWK